MAGNGGGREGPWARSRNDGATEWPRSDRADRVGNEWRGHGVRSGTELNRLLAMMDVAVRHLDRRRLDGIIEQAAAMPGCVGFAYVSSGRAGLTSPDRHARRCDAGTMILIPAGLNMSFAAEPDGEAAELVIGVAEVRLSGAGLLDRIKVPIFAALGDSALVRHSVEALAGLGSGDRSAVGAGPLADSLMKTCILTVLMDFFGRPGIDLKIIGALADPRLATVIASVLERPQEPHSLASMAERAGLSRSAFSRLFAEAMGQPPTEFVGKTRLYYAAEILRSSAAPIKTVAGSVGFSSRSHFSRAFREAYGVDPTAYRQAQAIDRAPPVRQDLKEIGTIAARNAARPAAK